MKQVFRLMSIVLIINASNAQSTVWIDQGIGQLSIQSSSNSPFPHPARMDGHVYNNIHYPVEKHYSDSSYAVFIPNGFTATGAVDLVFYFHGWNNNIQHSIEKFKLLEQFSAARKNAIFVFPEGPRNAPDSFAGQMEEEGVFAGLVEDVLSFLRQEGQIKVSKPGKIILTGHSGAYRGIAHILDRGGLTENITEVYLFDALYAEEEKFFTWLENEEGRMINICTPNGGTLDNSTTFLDGLSERNMSYARYDKNEITETELVQEKIVFVFSSLGHSEVIDPYFQLFLTTSHLNDID